MVEAFTPEQVEAFHRDGFLVVEEGLVPERALELLRERYLRLFDGDYETGIRPDEVNWVPGRDPEDRTRQLCNAWKSDNIVAAQVLSRSEPASLQRSSCATAACGSSRTTSSGSRRAPRRSASTRTPRTPTTSSHPR